MDPFSIISGVAGVATAGSALASTLYSIISSIRDAPREMIDIAHGIRELSAVLKELRRALKDGRHIIRNRLFKSVRSLLRRVQDLHYQVDDLLDHSDGGMSRVIWAFRKSKATKLMARIDSHKVTVNLMATTILLAIEIQDRKPARAREDEEKPDAEPDRRELQREAETLVLATSTTLQNLLPGKLYEEKGTQTHDLFEDHMHDISIVSNSTTLVDVTQGTEPSNGANTQLERWNRASEDTATWLYRLVFQQDQLSASPSSSTITFPRASVLDFPTLLPSQFATAGNVIDGLLLQWTDLTIDEITSISTGGTREVQALMDWENHLNDRVKMLEIAGSEDASSSLVQERLSTPYSLPKSGERVDLNTSPSHDRGSKPSSRRADQKSQIPSDGFRFSDPLELFARFMGQESASKTQTAPHTKNDIDYISDPHTDHEKPFDAPQKDGGKPKLSGWEYIQGRTAGLRRTSSEEAVFEGDFRGRSQRSTAKSKTQKKYYMDEGPRYSERQRSPALATRASNSSLGDGVDSHIRSREEKRDSHLSMNNKSSTARGRSHSPALATRASNSSLGEEVDNYIRSRGEKRDNHPSMKSRSTAKRGRTHITSTHDDTNRVLDWIATTQGSVIDTSQGSPIQIPLQRSVASDYPTRYVSRTSHKKGRNSNPFEQVETLKYNHNFKATVEDEPEIRVEPQKSFSTLR